MAQLCYTPGKCYNTSPAGEVNRVLSVFAKTNRTLALRAAGCHEREKGRRVLRPISQIQRPVLSIHLWRLITCQAITLATPAPPSQKEAGRGTGVGPRSGALEM